MRFFSIPLHTACLALALMASPALAADPAAPVAATPAPAPAANPAPNPAANPLLANYIQQGARLFYLGNRSGLDGWLVYKDAQVQVAYATADAQTVIVGNMWDDKGVNMTNAQVKTLLETNKDVIATLNGQNTNRYALPLPPEVVQAARTSGGNAAPISAGASPGEKLVVDLKTMVGVTVGSTTAPMLMMVMDPDCPHCQATWKALRDAVFKNIVQVRLIPIANPDSDNERAAGQLLHVADPLNAWDKYVGGDKSQLAGTPGSDQIIGLHANHIMTDSWHINTTPTLVYRGKDGKIKIVQGEPDKIETVLNDLAP